MARESAASRPCFGWACDGALGGGAVALKVHVRPRVVLPGRRYRVSYGGGIPLQAQHKQ